MTIDQASPPRAVPVLAAPRFAEKAAYAGGNFGNILLSTIIGSFLLIYLTDVVGLAAAAVGVLFLVARIIDGLTDPVMGYIVDHLPVLRSGRFRGYLLLGGALAAASFIALFLAPVWLPNALLVTWVAYLVWGLAFDAMDIPLNSLLPAMTANARARGQLAGIKGVTYLVGTAVVTAVALPLVGLFGGGAPGWQATILVIAAVSLTLTAIASRGVRERVRPVAAEQYAPRDIRRMFFSTRAVPVLLLAKIATSAASAAMLACLPFFFTYYAGDAALVSLAAIAMVAPMALGSILAPALSRTRGFKPIYLASLVIAIIGLSGIAVLPELPGAAYLVCLAITGLGFGGAVTLNYAILAELTDYTEWRSGHRAEASLASLASFASKAGLGIGGALIAFVLAASGYVAGAEQTANALTGIRLAQSLVPIALVAIGGLVFIAYPVTKEVAATAVAELTARREAPVAQADPDVATSPIDDPKDDA